MSGNIDVVQICYGNKLFLYLIKKEIFSHLFEFMVAVAQKQTIDQATFCGLSYRHYEEVFGLSYKLLKKIISYYSTYFDKTIELISQKNKVAERSLSFLVLIS